LGVVFQRKYFQYFQRTFIIMFNLKSFGISVNRVKIMKNVKNVKNVNKTILFVKDFFDRSGIKYNITINEKNEIVVNPRE